MADTCDKCKHWNRQYLRHSDEGWRSVMIREAGFGGCMLFESGLKYKNYAGEPDIEAQIEDGAFIFGNSLVGFVTHKSFGCNRFEKK